MSALYGSITGERGTVTKAAHKAISAHVRGWHDGARIEGRVLEDGRTSWAVYRTSGSNGAGSDELIAEWDEGQAFSQRKAEFED